MRQTCPLAKEHLELPTARKTKERLSSRASTRSTALATS